MEYRGYFIRVYKLVFLVMKNFKLFYNYDIYLVINDIYWACAFSYNLGKNEFFNMISLLIDNVYCVIVLLDVLRRCILIAFGLGSIDGKRRVIKYLFYDKDLFRKLMDVIIYVYIVIIYLKLIYISFRYYGDFIDFFSKVREMFFFVYDGYI